MSTSSENTLDINVKSPNFKLLYKSIYPCRKKTDNINPLSLRERGYQVYCPL